MAETLGQSETRLYSRGPQKVRTVASCVWLGRGFPAWATSKASVAFRDLRFFHGNKSIPRNPHNNLDAIRPNFELHGRLRPDPGVAGSQIDSFDFDSALREYRVNLRRFEELLLLALY